MKKNTLTGCAIAAIALVSFNASANVTTFATATWDARATKDTTSSLVVTPLKSLKFQYAEGMETFNKQQGIFDIAIHGQSGATDFSLTSRIINNTLSRSADDSTLQVGVAWNGQPLNKTTAVNMINTENNVSAGLDLLALSSAYAGTTRVATQGTFDFTIDSATSDGTTSAAFKDLSDGAWDGDVQVQFTAVWNVPRGNPES